MRDKLLTHDHQCFNIDFAFRLLVFVFDIPRRLNPTECTSKDILTRYKIPKRFTTQDQDLSACDTKASQKNFIFSKNTPIKKNYYYFNYQKKREMTKSQKWPQDPHMNEKKIGEMGLGIEEPEPG